MSFPETKERLTTVAPEITVQPSASPLEAALCPWHKPKMWTISSAAEASEGLKVFHTSEDITTGAGPS